MSAEERLSMPSRRVLLAVAAALPAAAVGLLAVTTVQASPVIQPSLRPTGPWLVKPEDDEWVLNHERQMFVMAMNALHPNGRAAAEHAMNAGMRASQFSFFMAPAHRTEANWWPCLMFDQPDGKLRSFRPRGEEI